jgi:tetratricopeptide (TPR) repeat protein
MCIRDRAYDFTINSNVPELRATSPFAVFWNAFTTRVDGGVRVPSLGVFWMVVFTWAVGTTIAVAYPVASKRVVFSGGWLARAVLLSAGISGAIFLVFGLIHAAGIAGDGNVERAGVPLGQQQFLDRVSGALAANITTYYVLLFLLVVTLGLLLWRTRPGGPGWLGRRGWLSLVAGGAFAVAALAMIVRVNLGLVQADIIYKVGQAYDTAGQYENAIYLYEKAIDRQPSEDYYYLFLGRSQLELARQSEGATRERYLRDAEQSLLRAQALNPLNTDHTANLGRLYLTWAQLAPAEERQQLLQKSLDYYQTATSLSPNAAHLHNEYGAAYQLAGDLDQALAKLQVSLALDSRYVDTYRRLSDLYDEAGQYELAIQALQQALELRPNDYQSHSALGYLYAQMGDLDKAIAENLVVLQLRPNDLASHRNLAILYQETGDLPAALSYAQQALTLARNDADRADLEAFILELQQSLQG